MSRCRRGPAPGRSSAPSRRRRASAPRTGRRPTSRRPAPQAQESSAGATAPRPSAASWAVMTQASGPPSGMQLRPETTLAAGDDRPRGLRRRVDPVVEDLRLPGQLAGRRIEGEDVIVRAGVDDVAAVDRHVAVGLQQVRKDVLCDVLRHFAPVLPDQVARDGVDGLNDVTRVRHVEHPAVGQRRPLLAARPEGACPDHPQVADVLPVDLIERAVAPAVERPAPHQPVARRRVLQHRVGDRHKAVVRRLRARPRRSGQGDRCHRHRQYASPRATALIHFAPRSVRLPNAAIVSRPCRRRV